jgi:glutathione S-transferase
MAPQPRPGQSPGAYKVYWNTRTGAFVPLALLARAGAACEKVRVHTRQGEQDTPGYRSLNPLGQVPTLMLPDGTLLTETAAMLLHLVDAFPAMGMAPPPGSLERARFDRWLIFLAVNIYEADLRLYYPDRYTAEAGGAAGVKEAAEHRLVECWRIFVDEALAPGPFVLGERFSAVDAYAAMLAAWFPPALERAPIAALVQATKNDPVIGQVWTETFEAD